jgi:hypothetical protein
MIETPLKSYGFTYECNNHSFSFVIIAQSDVEAKQRVSCMNSSVFVGELKPENDALQHDKSYT